MPTYPLHPVASLFPAMTPKDYADLKADIKANGQREPIWLHDDQVIDGRHRLRACEELGITPSLCTWRGGSSLVAFVVSLNLHRRHLDASQRAAIGVEVEALLKAENEAKEKAGKGPDGSGGRGRKKNPGASLPQGNGRAPKGTEEAAKTVGSRQCS
jgi:ParB-like chromosome segregation protein Spo0J